MLHMSALIFLLFTLESAEQTFNTTNFLKPKLIEP